MKFIAVLNSINATWLAIIMILIGMGYGVVSHVYGINGDAATGVIGAGIGLITGHALADHGQPPPPVDPAAK
jgi:hypothetical protein